MPDIVTGITAGSSLLGALGGSEEEGGGTTTAVSAPWEPQQPFLTYGFGEAQNAYNNARNMGAYTGPRVAALNPFQTQGANRTAGYANTLGARGANALGSSGLGMLGQGMGFGQNANAIFARASQDPTQQILGTAAQYASNPYADGMIDAANRDTQRMLTEQTLPSLARTFAGSGNTNSTRAGVEQAIAERGAADRMNDTAASIRSNLFNTGLSMGQNQYNQNLQNMLAANSDLLQAFNAGSNNIISGQQAAGNNFDQLTTAGGLFQNQNQNLINANMAQFNEQRDVPMSLVQQYMSTVGGNYGGTKATTEPTTGGGFMGALTGGLGGAMSGLGAAGKLGGFDAVKNSAIGKLFG